MSKPVVVTFERKSYTWDGRIWYGTEDHTVPPRGMIHKLDALIPKEVMPPKPSVPRQR